MTTPTEATAPPREHHPTLRLLHGLRPHWRRLLPAALAAAGSELAAAALMATAAWLITRAAEQPPLASVALAIVAVRALALGRGALRRPAARPRRCAAGRGGLPDPGVRGAGAARPRGRPGLSGR
ncbi:hypothetical protein [Streptomyces alboflavus]|uniref:hypothetical protein n=1 Tax=Streptomyces alboflavus TaxID=67267 RepID=UPI0036C915FE